MASASTVVLNRKARIVCPSTSRRRRWSPMLTSEVAQAGADGDGEIQEVPVVRIAVGAGEGEAPGVALGAVAFVRVVQREHGLDEDPGRENRDADEDKAKLRALG